MAHALPINDGQIADADTARLLSLTHAVEVQKESLNGLNRIHEHMMRDLDDTLDAVVKLEQQQGELQALLLARCAQLLETPEFAEEPAAALLRKVVAAVDAPKPPAADRQAAAPAAPATPRPEACSVEAPPAATSPRAASPSGPECATTLMVRPVPRGCSQEELVALWPPNCPASPYDMLYAPHRKTRKSLGSPDGRKPRNGLQGYVFINFASADAADHFRETWHGRLPEAMESGQAWSAPLEITEACVQGFEANMRGFTAVDLDSLDADKWPAVFIDGQRQSFEAVARGFRP